MSKRARTESIVSSATNMDDDTNVTPESESDSGVGNRGKEIIPMHMPIKARHSTLKTFTKHFYFKIYANDWLVVTQPSGTTVTGWMNYIPYQALAMYLSPGEYMKLVRNTGWAEIKDAKFQLEYKAVRTPFDANNTDAAEANGNLQFEIQRFDGLEKMLPFDTVDVPLSPGEPVQYNSYVELIQRLYGVTGFARYSTGGVPLPATMRERGLTWRPSWGFNFNVDDNLGYGDMYRDFNKSISSLPIGEFVTERLNTNQVKMGEGYCFNKTYKPKNGLITAATSGRATSTQTPGDYARINGPIRYKGLTADMQAGAQDATQWQAIYPDIEIAVTTAEVSGVGDLTQLQSISINNLTASQPATYSQGVAASRPQIDPLTNPVVFDGGPQPTANGAIWEDARTQGWPPIQVIDGASLVGNGNDRLGYGYNNAMAYYTIADLENYSEYPDYKAPPITRMESFCIGAVPKTTKQNTTVAATLEFECSTEITVECFESDHTYFNCAYSIYDSDGGVGPDGSSALPGAQYIDSFFRPSATDPQNGFLYGGKWQQQEHTSVLRDPKKWAIGRYGAYAKPLFNDLTAELPVLRK